MNLWQRIFKGKPASEPLPSVEILSGGSRGFTAWGGVAYENDIYRAGIDAIARNGGKLKGGHVVQYGDNRREGDHKLNRLLQVQPNPYMSAYDMLYRLITHYYLYNNAFAFLQKDTAGEVIGVYPMRAAQVDFMTDPTGGMFCKFYFTSGKNVILPYSEIIHLRRHYNENDLLGDPNTALTPALELAHTQNEGILYSIKSNANIRGILHFTQILAPEKLKEEKDRFMADYLSIANEGGVVATDQKTEYTPINVNSANVDKNQMNEVRNMIYNYLGISESIVNSSYTEDEWAAFYESVIEVIATQMSLEFTRKIFTDREQAFGNSILFESGRLQFSSNLTKLRLINTLVPYGLLTVNQALEILNLPSVPDGDKRYQTLNLVDAKEANQYQLDKPKSIDGGMEL